MKRPSHATAFLFSWASVCSNADDRPFGDSLHLADTQVAAEGFDVDAALAAAHLRTEFAAGAVGVFADLPEIAAQVAAEAAGMDRGRQAGGHLDLHVAAHAVDVDAALFGRSAVELYVAGHRAQVELLPWSAAGLDAPGNGLQVGGGAQRGRQDV